MRIDSSGNVGIGTSSPASKLTIGGSGANRISFSAPAGTQFVGYDGTADALQVASINSIIFQAGGYSERARIDSSGNLLVGTTSASETVVGARITAPDNRFISTKSESTNSASTFVVYSTGAAAYRFYVGMGGTVFATSTTISAISDIRYKENIRDLDVGLDKIMALKPRLYDWKEGKGVDIKNARGFIAQEFEEVFPDLIDEWQDPAPEGEEPYKSVRQDLIPVLVKAIQEMKAIIDTQASTITQLQADVAALKGASA
jgi:hypothetical protein